mgnify:CR=1 FL=1
MAARHFHLAGKLGSIDRELFVLNSSNDAVHDQRYYPVITRRLSGGRFLSLQVDEKRREKMIGIAVREFARVGSTDGVPPSLKRFEREVR